MSQRKILVRKMNANNEQVVIDDSLHVIVEVYLDKVAIDSNKASARFEFHNTSNNMQRIMKQVRAYQRRNNIRFSVDDSKTHYELKCNVDRKSVLLDAKVKCNVLKIFHHYDAQAIAQVVKADAKS